MKQPVLIIAEAGVNHNGDMDLAKKLIDVASEAGADIVKFQTFKAEKIVSKKAEKAGYQKEAMAGNDNSQLSMLKKLELSESQHVELINYCNTKPIQFLSTAFDLESINLLENLSIEIFKIPSGEITNYPYLKRIAETGKQVIMSTGMATMGDIQAAMTVLLTNGINKTDITLLHCNTQYPTPMKDVNLKAMLSIGSKFGTKYGYSDHTAGIEIPVAAVALGATIIEKHFTLDKNLEGPDHKASLDPVELKQMVDAIRNIEIAIGSGIKKPSESEKTNIIAARKSIHYSKPLLEGHIITESDLIMKRPGSGISPMEFMNILNKRLRHQVNEDDIFKWEDIA